MGRWFSDYLARLNRSFGAVYALLERPKAARRTVVGLLAVHSVLLTYSAYVHSPTLNEPGHLVAGLSNWRLGRFDIYAVNPPLVRMTAAIPVLAAGYSQSWSDPPKEAGARREFGLGEKFVAANGERAFMLFMIARWACIPFSWIGAVVCYCWARDLYGRPSGVLACAIWCSEPTILAHASLITPDAHATSLGLAACYTFWKWLRHPTWAQAMLTGVVLGLAELAKTTLILFYPLWPLLWIAYRWPERRLMSISEWLRQAGMLVLRMAIGIHILNLGYGYDGSFKSLNESRFVSRLFCGESAIPTNATPPPSRPILQPTFPSRFAGHWLGTLPLPFPEQYLAGIDLQQKDFEEYGRPSYLRGTWQDEGWWYYYIYAVSIKTPLGILVLLVVVPLLRIINRRRWHDINESRQSPRLRDSLILLAPPLIIFGVVSSKSGFSEHMRYVLPCFPFIFIWISQFAQAFCKPFQNSVDIPVIDPIRYLDTRYSISAALTIPLVAALVTWAVASSAFVYPHSLSYFNESVGGPRNGGRHLLGSNVDWGQDLRYASSWLTERSHLETCAVAYYGSFSPHSVGVSGIEPVTSGSPLHFADSQSAGSSGVNALLVDRYLISINFLNGSTGYAYDGGPKSYVPPFDLALLNAHGRRIAIGYSMSIIEISVPVK